MILSPRRHRREMRRFIYKVLPSVLRSIDSRAPARRPLASRSMSAVQSAAVSRAGHLVPIFGLVGRLGTCVARPAPRSPEVQQDDRAFERTERHLNSVDIRQRQVESRRIAHPALIPCCAAGAVVLDSVLTDVQNRLSKTNGHGKRLTFRPTRTDDGLRSAAHVRKRSRERRAHRKYIAIQQPRCQGAGLPFCRVTLKANWTVSAYGFLRAEAHSISRLRPATGADRMAGVVGVVSGRSWSFSEGDGRTARCRSKNAGTMGNRREAANERESGEAVRSSRLDASRAFLAEKRL